MRHHAKGLHRPVKADGPMTRAGGAGGTPVRRATHGLRRLVMPALTTAAVVLLASPAPAAQVFSQFDIIVRSHINETPAGEDRVVTRPATARIRITDLSRELADKEMQALEDQVPDPLNELCVSSKDGACAATAMEASLEQRASGLLAELPDLDFGEVSAHIAARRDDEATTATPSEPSATETPTEPEPTPTTTEEPTEPEPTPTTTEEPTEREPQPGTTGGEANALGLLAPVLVSFALLSRRRRGRSLVDHATRRRSLRP